MNEIESLELKIAHFLRAGVIISGVIMFAGWMTQFKLSGNPFFNFETYDRISLSELIKFHIHKKDWGILLSYLGLISLISLPLIRVLLTAILFIKQKEFKLAVIAVVVLIGLMASMSLGIEL
jgi:uncharacterized membrane protein